MKTIVINYSKLNLYEIEDMAIIRFLTLYSFYQKEREHINYMINPPDIKI